MHISEKSEPAWDAADQRIVSLVIAGGARYEIARSAARSIFVPNAHRFPVPSSNESIKGTGLDIKSV
jgi:hypothetical protein